MTAARRRPLLLALPAMLLSAAVGAVPPERPADLKPLAARSLILDVARFGERVLAVGERGHILMADQGQPFVQVRAPVRSTLTALGGGSADRPIFAVGHDGVILKSLDRGATWHLVFSAPDQARPLLDVALLDHDRVLAVGAYGWLVRSDDAGASWSEASIDRDEPHLNGLATGDGGAILVAAEFGLVYLSRDSGTTFDRQTLPYRGSFLGALRLDGAWLVFGLRGRVYRRADGAPEWRRVEVPTEATLLAGLERRDGGIVLGGLDGTLLASSDGHRFELVQDPERRTIAAIVELGDGSLLLAGEDGLRRMIRARDTLIIEPVPTRGP